MRELDEWLRHRLRALQLNSGDAARQCIANCVRSAQVGRSCTGCRQLAALVA